MMSKYLINFAFLIFSFLPYSFSQSYLWTGSAGSNDFFDENNWSHSQTGNAPPLGTIDPGVDINVDLYAGCGVEADSLIQMGSGSLFVESGELKAPGIKGGKLTIREGGYVELWGNDPLQNGINIDLISTLGWIKLPALKPQTIQTSFLADFSYNQQTVSYPGSLRIDNYYDTGSVVRVEDLSSTPLSIYDQENLTGNSAQINIGSVYKGNAIPGGMNNKVSSFILRRGHMATLAVNENGTGKSKVFIASEKDLKLESLPASLSGGVSFIRVIPWNWASQKGIGGNVLGLDNTWFYLWSNNGNSAIDVEYAPMAWGRGGANDQADIDKYLGKYKATHILGFNEPDDCNGQSGQYFDMCVPDTAINYYENLMKTGLRMVSPACREGAWDDWLKDFNDLAVQRDIRIDVIAVHWYDWGSSPANSPNANPQNVFNRFKNYLRKVHDLYGLPIWITEFNANPNRSTATNLAFMELALPFLDTLSYVERYAWFQPSSGTADYYDPAGNYTDVGVYYRDRISAPAVKEDILESPSNLDKGSSVNPYKALCSISTAMEEEVKEPLLELFPNPVDKWLNLRGAGKGVKFEIIGINSRIVLDTDSQDRIDVSGLASGVYLIRVGTHWKKFVKK